MWFDFAPYACIVVSIICLWFRGFTQKLAPILFGAGVIFGLKMHAIDLVGLVIISSLLLLATGIKKYGKDNQGLTLVSLVLHGAFITLCTLLLLNKLPGIDMIPALAQVKLCTTCAPYTMNFKLDQLILSYVILSTLIPPNQQEVDWKAVFKWTAIILPFCIIVLIGASFTVNYINFFPKLPSETFMWVLNNLMFVCMAQEVFYRGYLQTTLTGLCRYYYISPLWGVTLASLAFGFLHYRGGVTYIFLSFIAGLFYGTAFLKSKRIESAILVHFGLNLFHFLFFTYPYYVRG